jgi:hypothetical protein
MPQVKVLPDAQLDPKAGQPKPRTSPIAFPYYDLDSSIEVAKVIHEKGGGSCDRAALATWLDYKGIYNGAFVTRVTSAKLFGVIEQVGNQLKITARGRAIVAQVTKATADRARREAFLAVPLFKKTFERFNGQTLPPDVGLKNLFASEFGVVSVRVGPTVRIMLDSAEQAGFFKVAGNRTRMVMPPLDGAVYDDAELLSDSKSNERDAGDESNGKGTRFGGGNGGGGNGQDGSGIHPAIYGLISALPEPGGLSKAKRDALIDAFTATIKFIYPDRETE